MNILSESDWAKVEPAIRAACPRLTATDLAEAQRRVDLLAAKIQSRHWISKVEAQRLVLAVLHRAGVLHVAA